MVIMSWEVNDEILDKSNIAPVKNSKTLFTYNKTIYYKKGAVAFLFSSRDLLESLVAESQILFEVKCIEKYKSEFIVKTSNALPISTGKIANANIFSTSRICCTRLYLWQIKGNDCCLYSCNGVCKKSPRTKTNVYIAWFKKFICWIKYTSYGFWNRCFKWE